MSPARSTTKPPALVSSQWSRQPFLSTSNCAAVLAVNAQGTILGAKCTPGSTITVTVDATGAVDESNEDDDVVQRPCPLG